MPSNPDPLVLHFHVPGTPAELKAWWTELPEVYEATDPREQPHRIEHVEDTPEAAIYRTYWRGPLGLEFKLTEHLHDEGPGAWRFVIPNPGFVIEDRYTAEPETQAEPDPETGSEAAGTRLTIRSTLTYTSWYGKLTRPLMLPGWRDKLTEAFSAGVAVYRDQRPG